MMLIIIGENSPKIAQKFIIVLLLVATKWEHLKSPFLKEWINIVLYKYSRVSYRCEMNKVKLYLSAQINLKKHTVDGKKRIQESQLLAF